METVTNELNNICEGVASISIIDKKLTRRIISKEESTKLHILLLKHSAQCEDTEVDKPKCVSKNCIKMKGYLKHRDCCQLFNTGKACLMCSRINNMLIYHARRCFVTDCMVPHCTEIKGRFLLAANEVLSKQNDEIILPEKKIKTEN